MPTKIKVTRKYTRTILSRYNKGRGLEYIADEFGLAVSVIRRVLTDEGVKIRGRGRPLITA